MLFGSLEYISTFCRTPGQRAGGLPWVAPGHCRPSGATEAVGGLVVGTVSSVAAGTWSGPWAAWLPEPGRDPWRSVSGREHHWYRKSWMAERLPLSFYDL